MFFFFLLVLGKILEKDFYLMVGMRNEKYVNNIKVEVEKVCLGVVFCVDIFVVGLVVVV